MPGSAEPDGHFSKTSPDVSSTSQALWLRDSHRESGTDLDWKIKYYWRGFTCWERSFWGLSSRLTLSGGVLLGGGGSLNTFPAAKGRESTPIQRNKNSSRPVSMFYRWWCRHPEMLWIYSGIKGLASWFEIVLLLKITETWSPSY